MNRALASLAILVALIATSGCSRKARWLHGRWVFDSEYTRQELAEIQEKAPPREGLVEGLQAVAESLVVPRLIESLEGSELRVTNEQLVMTDKEGNGKALTYEVIAVPDSDTITLKQSDGEVRTFHRDGGRFWTTSTGDVNVRAYFVRAKK